MRSPSEVSADWIDAINQHDLEALSRTLHDDYVGEFSTQSSDGAKVAIEAWRKWFVAFPDFHIEVLQAFAESNNVCTRLHMSGTHEGILRLGGVRVMSGPIKPTGYAFAMPGCLVHHIDGDRIRRGFAYWDSATLLRQIEIL